MPTFLNLNYEHVFHAGGMEPLPLAEHHRPYFLASWDAARSREALEEKRQELARKVDRAQRNPLESHTLSRVRKVGEIEEYQSFSSIGKKRLVFKVHTERPGDVPGVSNHLFSKEKLSCYEFDVPYEHRALSDLAAEGKFWVYDTGGKDQKLKVLAYDIETFDFSSKESSAPINIIGYSAFDMTINSHKSLENEDFNFDIIDMDEDWEGKEVVQLSATEQGDEIKALRIFVENLKYYDVVTGHNLITFDNQELYNRVEHYLANKSDVLSKEEEDIFRHFLEVQARRSSSYHFGRKQEGVNFYPTSFDTFHAARRFYRFMESFSLKAVAPFLGVKIPGRKYIDVAQGSRVPFQEWLLYNEHDVREQLGVSMSLLSQALPLAFSTGMPLEHVLDTGTTGIWDFMAMVRAARTRKIMPPIHRAVYTARAIHNNYGSCPKQELAERVRESQGSDDIDKDLLKFAKYGEEMPDWAERPYSIYNTDSSFINPRTKEPELTSYNIPGGMTIHPDEVSSQLLPWWNIVAADVGAMYPTILRGMNLGADTVRLATIGEKPDHWVWVKRVSKPFSTDFLKQVPNIPITPEGIQNNPFLSLETIKRSYGFADHGHLLGIKRSGEPSLVSMAMSGIMQMIAKTKAELKKAKQGTPEHKRLSMMYQSVKGVRNAGTHGILIASGVGCRQFNVWGGAAITTKGQEILHDVMSTLQERKMRVVYGDTDGIYIASARNATLIPELREALQNFLEEEPEFMDELSEKRQRQIWAALKGEVGGTGKAAEWISQPEDVLATIEECNRRWRELLEYEDFELEPEVDTGMVFVKHKNYLIFNVEEGRLRMQTKGNNFKGSDKAEVARKALFTIMKKVLFSHLVWEDEDKERKKFTQTIKKVASREIEKLSMKGFGPEDFHLIQGVSAPKSYKKNQDGSLSGYGQRAAALEQLIGRSIRGTQKFKFVVAKKPLPGIEKPSKSGIKPIDYMWPVELVKPGDIDVEWYRDMIANYVKGAFGLKDLSQSVQFSLTDFM